MVYRFLFDGVNGEQEGKETPEAVCEDRRKAEIRIKDQYYKPHETWHSIGEVLKWFGENEIEYLNCSPAILGTDGEDIEAAGTLFEHTRTGTAYQRLVTQLSWIGTIAREGALFDVIGRKKGWPDERKTDS